MLPLILGAVALGAAGLGVHKYNNDDDFKESINEKIETVAFAGADGINWIEDKFKLNEYEFSKEDVEELKSSQRTEKNDYPHFITPMITGIENNQILIKEQFDSLYDLKI